MNLFWRISIISAFTLSFFLSEGDKHCANNDITRKRSDDKRFLQYDHLKIKRWLVAFLKSYTTEKYAKLYILTFDPQ